ncbi:MULTISPECIES: hypothetical protein [Helicobacter]|uniref:TauD/TfdA-like domain-containing protein n=1 Tax=Helicobacter ibis TaxID=2962633 RepID=A0ABT4VGE7_9HELI|nr:MULTISPECIES: hypothetical protein [Helicobacter]MDA3967115.1 hypothetical protein [Helicobacter sp. WB40]MDA3969243.1 hypothetical protein [Helicobacter ibis]
MSLVLDNICKEDLEKIRRFDDKFTSAVIINNILKESDLELHYIAHESLSDIFGLIDIHYEYEDHKWLCLKEKAFDYKEWGGGVGMISLHSDDIYETRDIDLLSLSICKDISNTPTNYLPIREIINLLGDKQLEALLRAKAKFISGKNVSCIKKTIKNLITYNDTLSVNLDFRNDTNVGFRMVGIDKDSHHIIEILRNIVENKINTNKFNGIGSFLIIKNKQVLHGRDKLNNIKKDAEKPRILIRSKGLKFNYKDFA